MNNNAKKKKQYEKRKINDGKINKLKEFIFHGVVFKTADQTYNKVK